MSVKNAAKAGQKNPDFVFLAQPGRLTRGAKNNKIIVTFRLARRVQIIFAPAKKSYTVSLPLPLAERFAKADGPALKVALFLLSHGAAEPENIAAQLALPEATVQRALRFWLDAGLVCEGEPQDDDTAATAVERREMNTAELAELTLRDSNVAQLLRETQRLMKRTIKHAEQLLLAELYEYDGMSVDVLLSAVAYTAPRCGSSFRGYLGRVARSWREQGIDTLEKAEKSVAQMMLSERRCAAVAKALGLDEKLIKTRERRFIDSWFSEYGYDETFAAEAALRTGKTDIAYLNSVLRDWHAKGYATVKETRAQTGNVSASRTPRKSGKDTYFTDMLSQYKE